MKVLLLGRFFVLAALAERLIRGEYIRYRYLTEVPREELQWRLGDGGGGYLIDWTRRPLIGDSLNIHWLLIGPPSNID